MSQAARTNALVKEQAWLRSEKFLSIELASFEMLKRDSLSFYRSICVRVRNLNRLFRATLKSPPRTAKR